MFTGIVEEVGTVTNVLDTGGDLRVSIRGQQVLDGLQIGDSVAVSGCCLTVVKIAGQEFTVELSKETVAKTAPRWLEGKGVNLERAMLATDRFGGHIVSGHVEGVGEVLDVSAEPGAYVLTMRAPGMGRYLIPKGSLTVDGISLTVVDVGGPAGSSLDLPADVFTLWIIPHTLEVTTLGELSKGSQVNLEPDLLVKYLERLTLMRQEGQGHVQQTS